MFVKIEEREIPLSREQHEGLDDVSKLLLKAASLIEERGWCQNHYRSADGRLCILGAIKVANGVEPKDGSGDGPVEEACHRVYKSVGMLAYNWNDNPFRTKEEVVAKLRAVALGG